MERQSVDTDLTLSQLRRPQPVAVVGTDPSATRRERPVDRVQIGLADDAARGPTARAHRWIVPVVPEEEPARVGDDELVRCHFDPLRDTEVGATRQVVDGWWREERLVRRFGVVVQAGQPPVPHDVLLGAKHRRQDVALRVEAEASSAAIRRLNMDQRRCAVAVKEIDGPAAAGIATVKDPDIAFARGVELQAERLGERRLVRPGRAGAAGADGGFAASERRLKHQHAVVFGVGDVEVAVGGESQGTRIVHAAERGRARARREARLAEDGIGRGLSRRKAEHAVVVGVRDPEVAGRIERRTRRLAERRCAHARAPIAEVPTEAGLPPDGVRSGVGLVRERSVVPEDAAVEVVRHVEVA